jgi:hypothetical protein
MDVVSNNEIFLIIILISRLGHINITTLIPTKLACYKFLFAALVAITIIQMLGNVIADHSGSLEFWDCGYESNSRHGCLFVYVKALRRADTPSKETYRLS